MALHAREVDWNPMANITALAHAAVKHWKKGDINWSHAVYFGVLHLGFAKGAVALASCRWETLLLSGALLCLRYFRRWLHLRLFFSCSHV